MMIGIFEMKIDRSQLIESNKSQVSSDIAWHAISVLELFGMTEQCPKRAGIKQVDE
jgi:hypothetical protein